MEERRGPDSGQVTHVKCRTCRALVLLDGAKMTLTTTHAELHCPACGVLVRVRLSDIEKTPEGIWSIASYAEEPERVPVPAAKGSLLRRNRRS